MIGRGDSALLSALLLVLLAAALAGERTRLRNVLPGPAIMLLGGAALSNSGLIARDAPVFGELARIAVPVGVFLLLLRANILQIVRETGHVLRYYLLGAATSLLGVLAAFLVVALPEAAKVAAAQAANVIGGSVNFIAVTQAVAMSPTTFSAVYVGSAPIMVGYLALVGVMARNPMLLRLLPRRPAAEPGPAGVPPTVGASSEPTPPDHLTALGLSMALALAVGAYALSEAALRSRGLGQYVVVAVTTVALLIANLAPRLVARISGDREVGTMLMYLFFATLGVGINLTDFGRHALYNTGFLAICVGIHLALLIVVARAMKGDLAEVLIGSIAGVAGPTTAAAMAASFDRRDLITPGILCGLLGFATATFIGMAVFGLLAT